MTTGYIRHETTSLSSLFGSASSGFGFGALDTKPQTDPNQHVDLTDIMPNATFHVAKVNPADKINASGNVNNVQVTNTSVEVKNDVNAVEAAYKEANNQAMNAIGDAMKQAVGAERADAVMTHLRPRGAEGAFAEGMRPMVDLHTGMAGSLYEMMNAVQRHSDNAEVNEVLTKTLKQLHEISEKQHSDFAADNKKPQPAFDFREIKTPQQLQNFIQRDITKDPVMQQIADARVGVEELEQNEELAAEVVQQREAKETQFSAWGVEFTSGALAETPEMAFREAPEVNPDVKNRLAQLKLDNEYKPAPAPVAAVSMMG